MAKDSCPALARISIDQWNGFLLLQHSLIIIKDKLASLKLIVFGIFSHSTCSQTSWSGCHQITAQ